MKKDRSLGLFGRFWFNLIIWIAEPAFLVMVVCFCLWLMKQSLFYGAIAEKAWKTWSLRGVALATLIFLLWFLAANIRGRGWWQKIATWFKNSAEPKYF